MTTKQAADIIRMLLGYLKGEIEPPKQETIEEAKAFEQQSYECLEMAIKALEQQPCDDEDNVGKSVATAFQFGMALGFGEKHDKIDRVMEEVKKAVTPKEKTGYWIDDADKIDAQFGRHEYKCSVCGRIANYYVGGNECWWDIYKPNFCPNCGAKMEVENE